MRAKNSAKASNRPFTLDVSLPAYELKTGMFVSNVDCGWLKTPFPLEGLLITSEEEIATLRRLTDYVTIDPTRSVDLVLTNYLEKTFGSGKYGLGYDDAQTLAGLTALGDANRPPPVEPDAQNQANLERLAQVQKSESKRSQWWRTWFKKEKLWPFSSGVTAPAPSRPRPAFIPPDIPLVAYAEPEFSWPTVPVAAAACNAAISLLADVAQGIASRSMTDFRTLERAAQTMAEHMIVHPNAIMWASKMLETDNRLYQRSLEVGIHLTILGRHLGFPRELLADLAMIGFLLDLGKVQADPNLFTKSGPLNAAETTAMQRHVLDSLAMIEQTDTLSDAIMRAIAEHHERIDGRGYPKGLSDADISLYGKMAAIVDSYVAMINPRPYAKTFAPHEAINELFAKSDTHWHAPLVEQFVQAVGVFPVGSLVEMASGHIAIVVEHNMLRRLEPRILIVTRSNKSPRPVPLQIDMLRHNARQQKARLRILKGLPDGSHGIEVRNYYFGSR